MVSVDRCLIHCINVLTQGQLESSTTAIGYLLSWVNFSYFYSLHWAAPRKKILDFTQVQKLALKTVPFMFNIPKVPIKSHLYCHTTLGVQNINTLAQFLFWYATSKHPSGTSGVIAWASVYFLIKPPVWARQPVRVVRLLRKVNTNDCLHLKVFGGFSVSCPQNSLSLKQTLFKL